MLLRKQIFRISLLLIVLSAAVLCIYGVCNYKSSASSIQTRSEFHNSFSGQGNPSFNGSPQARGDQSPGSNSTQRMAPPNSAQHMASPNGRMSGEFTNTYTKYAPYLITYSIIFLALFIVLYYLYINNKLKFHADNEKILIIALICVGMFLRIYASTLIDGYPFDINIFKNWATAAANNLFQVYSNSGIDYPPLYIYILSIIGKIATLSTMSHYFTILLKLPSIIADIITSLVIYRLAKKYLTMEISVLLSAFYIFNPAVFINSTLWGQVDSFFTLIIVFSVYMLSEKKTGFASALFAAAVMMKPQGIIFLPLLGFELFRQKSFKSIVKVVTIALGTAIAIILPFSLSEGPLWIFKLFSSTLAEYPYASVNAFNFFSLIGKNYVQDANTLFLFSYHNWGIIYIAIITAFSWYIYIKGNSRIFASAAALLQIAGVFTFSTRMHERYLFPAAALTILAFIYLKDKRLLLLSTGFSSTIYINTQYVFFGTNSAINSVSFTPMLIFTSLLNVMLFVYLCKVLFDIAVKKNIYPPDVNTVKYSPPGEARESICP